MNIFIFDEKTKIKRKQNQIAIYKEEEKILSYPIDGIDNIFLFGNIEISPSAISFLLRKNKAVLFLTETGFYKGILFGKENHSFINKRKKQYTIHFSEEKSLKFAKNIITLKILEIEKYFHIDLSKEKESLQKAKNLQSVLGLEGSASAKMFETLKKLLRNLNIPFSKRIYNPPKDEVNAILSSAYTMVHNILIPLILKHGYDPYLGILHSKKGIHHAFASDVIEIYRPKITYLVYLFLKENPISSLSFNKTEEKVYLEKESIKLLTAFLMKNLQKTLEKTGREIDELFDKSFNKSE